LQLEANEFGYCAIYEDELQRLAKKMKKTVKQSSRSLRRNTDFDSSTTNWVFVRCLPKKPATAKSELAKSSALIVHHSERSEIGSI
jgi:hypothetical protein